MKNSKPLPFFFFFIQDLLLILFLISPLMLPSQTSLFELAVTLDDLDERLTEDDKAAEAFFEHLKDLYPGKNVSSEVIAVDFRNNSYLNKRVEFAFDLLQTSNQGVKDAILILYEQAEKEIQELIDQASFTNFKGAQPILDANPDILPPAIALLERNPKLDNLDSLKAKLKILQEVEGKTTGTIASRINQSVAKLNKIRSKIIDEEEKVTNEKFDFIGEGDILALNMPGLADPVANTILVQAATQSSFQSSLIDATATFIAERMKEELNMAFFERFERFLEGHNIHILFPNTAKALKSAISSDYALMIQVFRKAFEKDLNTIIFNLGGFLDKELGYQELIDTLQVEGRLKLGEILQHNLEVDNTDLDSLTADLTKIQEQVAKKRRIKKEVYQILEYILLSIKTIEMLNKGEHPTTLISFLDQNIKDILPNADKIKPALVILNVVSQSLITHRNGKVEWLNREELEVLNRNAQLRNFYLGLVYQKILLNLEVEREILRKEKRNLVDLAVKNKNIPTYKIEEVKQLSTVLLKDLENFSSIDAKIGYTINKSRFIDTLKAKRGLNETEKKLIEKAVKQVQEQAKDYSELIRNDSLLSAQINQIIKEEDTIFYQKIPVILNKNRVTTAKKDWDDIYEYTYEKAIDILKLESLPFDSVDNTHFALLRQTVLKMLKDSLQGSYQDENLQTDILQQLEFILDLNLNYVSASFQSYIDEKDIIKPLKEEAASIFIEHAKQENKKRIEEFLATDPDALRLEYQILTLNKHLDFTEKLLNNSKKFGAIISEFHTFSRRIENLRQNLVKLQALDKNKLTSQDFVVFLRSSLEILEQVFRISLTDEEKEDKLKTIIGLNQNLLDAYAAILEKDYNAVIMNAMFVADSILELSFQEKVNHLVPEEEQKAFRLLPRFLRSQSNSASNSLEKLEDEKELHRQKIHQIFRYGAFIAAMVEAKDAEEIKKAIKAIALPAGSYSIKRKTAHNISLNAYPGLTGGWELASNSENSRWAFNGGFTALLGVGIHWGNVSKINLDKYQNNSDYREVVNRSSIVKNNRFLSGQSHSLFLSLIDLGAVVLFRLDDATGALPSDVSFQQIFSPGILYGYGFRNAPISLLGGLQISPQLRKIDELKANSFRFNLSFVVDIPIVNFHTRKDKKEKRKKK